MNKYIIILCTYVSTHLSQIYKIKRQLIRLIMKKGDI